MSIEAEVEYEEDAPFEEPEHPHRRIIDRFFDELAKPDLSGAAQELRTLHAAGGSLRGSDVGLLADFLVGSVVGIPFPFQLGFEKRGKGRPRHALQSHLQAPWNAFASGDEVKASEALRKFDIIEGDDVEMLARLLSDDPAIHEHFPWRLVPKRPEPGQPKTMSKLARQFTIACMVAEARRRHKQMKGAVGEVCERTGLSPAMVYKALKAKQASEVDWVLVRYGEPPSNLRALSRSRRPTRDGLCRKVL